MQRGRQLRRYRSFQNVNLNILSFEREGEVRFRKPNRLFFLPLEWACAVAYIRALKFKRRYILYQFHNILRFYNYIVLENISLCLRWKFSRTLTNDIHKTFITEGKERFEH